MLGESCSENVGCALKRSREPSRTRQTAGKCQRLFFTEEVKPSNVRSCATVRRFVQPATLAGEASPAEY